MSRRQCAMAVFVGGGGVLVACAEARANVISIFTQNVLLHLFVGNAVIGVVEGWLIGRFFKTSMPRAIVLLIAANYFSTWAGAIGLMWLGWQLQEPLSRLVTLDTLQAFIWMLVLCAWLCTTVLEWPFCLVAMRRRPHRIRDSLLASLGAQTVSYVAILVLNPPFGHFRGAPLGEPQINIAPVSSFADAGGATVYFISAADGDVYQVRPDDGSLNKVAELGERRWDIRLSAKPTGAANSWKLWLEPDVDPPTTVSGPRTDTGIIVAGVIGPDPRADTSDSAASGPTRRPAIDFRPEAERDPRVYVDYLGDTWLGAERRVDGKWHEVLHLQFDRTILHWRACNATVLPGGQVVYQLGSQIVLLDLDRRKLGLIALGRGPVVFLPAAPASRSGGPDTNPDAGRSVTAGAG